MLESIPLFLLGLVLGIVALPLAFLLYRWLQGLTTEQEYKPLEQVTPHAATIHPLQCSACQHPAIHIKSEDQCCARNHSADPNKYFYSAHPYQHRHADDPSSPTPPISEDPIVTAFRQCVYSVLHIQAFNPETLPAWPSAWPALFSTGAIEALAVQMQKQSLQHQLIPSQSRPNCSHTRSLSNDHGKVKAGISPSRTPTLLTSISSSMAASHNYGTISSYKTTHNSSSVASVLFEENVESSPQTPLNSPIHSESPSKHILIGKHRLNSLSVGIPKLSSQKHSNRKISSDNLSNLAPLTSVAATPILNATSNQLTFCNAATDTISNQPISPTALSPTHLPLKVVPIQPSRRRLAIDRGSIKSAPKAYSRSHRFKPFDPGRHGAPKSTLHRPFTGDRQKIDGLKRYHYAFDSSHEWTIPHYGQVKFTDHSPMVFSAIRDYFGYSLAELEMDLTAPLSMSSSTGKSDAVFLRSKSGRFLFKSLRGSEADNLKAFLPSYVSFIIDNPDTLLPRYLGMYTFDPPSRRPSTISYTNSTHHATNSDRSSIGSISSNTVLLPTALQGKCTFVMMPNVFDTMLPIDFKYDFKGSTVGRQTLRRDELLELFNHEKSIHHDQQNYGLNPNTGVHSKKLVQSKEITFKELDFSRLLGEGIVNLIHLGAERRDWLVDRLTKDTALLKRHEFMDYSLLIGVHVYLNDPIPHACATGVPILSDSNSAAAGMSISPAVSILSSTVSQLNGSKAGSKPTQPYLSAFQTIANLVRGTSPEISSMSASPSGQCSISIGDTDDDDEHPSQKFNEHVHSKYEQPFTSMNEPYPYATHSCKPPQTHCNTITHTDFHGGMRSVGQDEVYYFGLIDALQKYNYFKWVERNLKKQTSQIIHGPTALTSMFSGSSSMNGGNFKGPSLNVMTTPPTSPSPLTGTSQNGSLAPPLDRVYKSSGHTRSRSATMLSRHVSPYLKSKTDASVNPGSLTVPGKSSSNTGYYEALTSPTKIKNHEFPLSPPQLDTQHLAAFPAKKRHSISLKDVPEQPESDDAGHIEEKNSTSQSIDDHTLSSRPAALNEETIPMFQNRHITFPAVTTLTTMPENSVEEPGRYASRLVDFIGGIVV
ncbi:hypothetical protein BDV3_001839 [Batrachochytrium dendrobatidis]|uniref:PIPK domain-containing protein n=1 Tax=Batrachochytrium dendrobatidis (strain JEL423) TaxID=403673 RepID=A0A177WUD7_BATDL|nr:hypothetical protein BDEG_26424 [Batrachochytrium dendrobatidis JEL423]